MGSGQNFMKKGENFFSTREGPEGVDSCSDVISQVILISNLRPLSLLAFILWTFENFTLFYCD